MADNLDQMVDEEEAEEGAPWMATFADLMSLLLTFFVLLLSFATMDIIKFKDAMGSMNNAFGQSRLNFSMNTAPMTSLIEYDYEKNDTFMKPPVEMPHQKNRTEKVVVDQNEELLKRIDESIMTHDLKDSVTVESAGRGVVVKVKGQLLYKSGSDVLKAEAYPLLDEIIGLVEEFPYNMSVEGHTDDTPINTARFPSNWELSTARAISTLRYILESGRIETERLGASGYADTRPLTSNDTPEGRRQNRRVEFIMYKE
ncbi:MAG: OmpA family protein [Deltaproteobacteria bacterium]|nr:OmpA family protein [Deltaproteobacteria bacterium]